jgi:hypothetical protein
VHYCFYFFLVFTTDGIYRTVEYVADPIHGFQAKVINSPGPAIHAVAAKKVIAPVVAHGGETEKLVHL